LGLYEWLSLGLGYFTVGALSALVEITLLKEQGSAARMFWAWPFIWLYVGYILLFVPEE
jgi:hypothetical protein